MRFLDCCSERLKISTKSLASWSMWILWTWVVCSYAGILAGSALLHLCTSKNECGVSYQGNVQMLPVGACVGSAALVLGWDVAGMFVECMPLLGTISGCSTCYILAKSYVLSSPVQYDGRYYFSFPVLPSCVISQCNCYWTCFNLHSFWPSNKQADVSGTPGKYTHQNYSM